VNTQNLCVCSQGPKVPPLVIPYVNAPGPGQTIAEWNMQQSSQIPARQADDDNADTHLSDEQMAHYVAQQAYEHQQQLQQQHMHEQQQYANYTPAQIQQIQQQQHLQQQQQQQQQKQYQQYHSQHDQPMG